MNYELASKVTIFCWNWQIQAEDTAYKVSETVKKHKNRAKCLCMSKKSSTFAGYFA